MFESVFPIALPADLPTREDIDRAEHDLACALPPDYRLFMTAFGPGTLDRETRIWSLDTVGDETPALREYFQDNLFSFFDNAADLLTPEDVSQLVFIGGSDDGDYFVIVPGDAPRFLELPRQDLLIGNGGPTMETFLDYLDPRTRFRPEARRIVMHGVVHEMDSQAGERVYMHPFTPAALDQAHYELTWGHETDDIANNSRPGHYESLESLQEFSIEEQMERYPLLRLLEGAARRDPAILFEMRQIEHPNARLSLPAYGATLEVGPGRAGLTLHVAVPQGHRAGLFKWLIDLAHTAGQEIPQAVLDQVAG